MWRRVRQHWASAAGGFSGLCGREGVAGGGGFASTEQVLRVGFQVCAGGRLWPGGGAGSPALRKCCGTAGGFSGLCGGREGVAGGGGFASTEQVLLVGLGGCLWGRVCHH